MGTLTPKAFAQLYSEMLDAARKSPEWDKIQISDDLRRRVELEYDAVFKSTKEFKQD